MIASMIISHCRRKKGDVERRSITAFLQPEFGSNRPLDVPIIDLVYSALTGYFPIAGHAISLVDQIES